MDVRGKHVYPGLFDAHTNLGLVEVAAVRATVDEREVGMINPNVEAIKAVNPDSELIPVARANGVLLAQTLPGGALLAGRSSIIQLDGWTWEDMALQTDVGMHLAWPRMSPVQDWRSPAALKLQNEQRDKALEFIEETFTTAAAYRTAREARGEEQPRDARWEAMLPVLRGELPLCVGADEVQQIQAAISFAERHKLRLIIHGGYDAELCAAQLKQYDVPVVIEGIYRLPQRRDDDYDAPFTLPERLRKAGIKFCIAGGGRHSIENTRNLPYHAATAIAFGLSPEDALRAITLAPAEIFGVAERVGSLEAGKDATLFVSDGDILETETQVQQAWIGGRAVDLTNRHKQLWRKYEEKYRRLQTLGE
jgi:imidazolonepropionase-like amidohydrolase